jgi:hypothetical protein
MFHRLRFAALYKKRAATVISKMTKLAMGFTRAGAMVLWISGIEPSILASALAPQRNMMPQTKAAMKNPMKNFRYIKTPFQKN